MSLENYGAAFVQPTTVRNVHLKFSGTKKTEFARLQKASTSFSPALKLLSNKDDEKGVNVNLLPDVDPLTLTALGFGLIAFNFFVLANMGDAGIAGFIARIINTFG